MSHIADRRRTAIWRDQIKILKQSGSDQEVDIHVINPFSNPSKLLTKNRDIRLVLDMVDGYLVDKPNFVKDSLRQLSRVGIREFM